MRKYITKADISLIVILTALSLVSFGGMRHMDFSNGHAVVEVDGKRVLELPLDRNVQTKVTGPLGVTEIAIEDRTVRVASSPCPQDRKSVV